MDADRFEALSKALASTSGRRAALRALVVSVLGAALATRVGLGDGDAAPKGKRQRRGQAQGKRKSCPPCKKRKKRKCKGSLPDGSACAGGACQRGRCVATAPPPPPPARQVVTQTFANTGPILIPQEAGGMGKASPYPSTIEVSGLTNGVITDVNVTLNGFNHPAPQEVDVMLAATQISGRNAIIMSDVGGNDDAVNLILELDDAAAAGLGTTLVSGTFQPTNINNGGVADDFPAPAPTPTGNSLLSTFNGQNPNGTWQLFVADDGLNADGTLTGGWSLQITAEVDV